MVWAEWARFIGGEHWRFAHAYFALIGRFMRSDEFDGRGREGAVQTMT